MTLNYLDTVRFNGYNKTLLIESINEAIRIF